MFRIRKLLATLVFVSSFSSAGAPQLAWSAGELDPSFGNGGIVLTDLGTGIDAGEALVVLPDDRLVVFGSFFSGTRSLALVRYLPDGSLDSSFGLGGIVVWSPGTSGRSPLDLALAPDGGLLVLLTADSAQHLARFDGEGNLDLTFATGGIYTFTVSGGGTRLSVTGDGRIYVTGAVLNPSRDIGLWRFEADGTLDASFGSGGMATLDTGLADNPANLAVLPDGRIVVGGGRYTTCCTVGDPMVARFLADGSLDPSFGTAGWSTKSFGVPGDPRGFAVQPDGRLVVGGLAGALSTRDFGLVRFEAEGAVDESFGSGGLVFTDFGGTDHMADLVVEASGRIIAGGLASTETTSGFGLAAYLPDGTPDPGFGSAGTVFVDFSFAVGTAAADDVALTANDTITAVGWAEDFNGDTGSDVALVRYLGGACGNGVLENGEDCDDGNTESGDCCSASCSAEPVGQPCGGPQTGCSKLECNAAAACVLGPAAPRPLCKAANHARLAVSDRTPNVPDDRDRLSFSWSRGEATDPADLGDPTTDTTYALCGYDISDGLEPELLFEVEAPAGGTCGAASCWRPTSGGFKYRDPDGTPAGMEELLLKAGPVGRGRMKARARGVFLDVAPLPFALPVVVQLVAADGACWQGAFVASDVTQSGSGRFRAHAAQ